MEEGKQDCGVRGEAQTYQAVGRTLGQSHVNRGVCFKGPRCCRRGGGARSAASSGAPEVRCAEDRRRNMEVSAERGQPPSNHRCWRTGVQQEGVSEECILLQGAHVSRRFPVHRVPSSVLPWSGTSGASSLRPFQPLARIRPKRLYNWC